MNCFDWRAQLAHRFDPETPTPADSSEARRHLDDCPSCRREALGIDPTLAFRGAAAWSPGAEESESIRLAVRALRRTERFREDSVAADSRLGERLRSRRRVAAAALFAAALALLPGVVDRGGDDRVDLGALGPVGAGLTALLGARPAAAPSVSPTAPAIDGLDRPRARVYEWGAEDLSVVMVVDESMDV